MGDMADFTLEQELTEWEYQTEYLAGFVTIEEALEAGVLDENGCMPYMGGPLGPPPVTRRMHKRSITCRCCDKHGLRWVAVGDKWRLFDGEKLHDCPKNPLQD